MTYMEHGMWEILDVLRRHHRGDSNVKISNSTKRSRNTVKRYLKTAKSLGWIQTEAPSEAIASRVLQQLCPGPPQNKPGNTEKILRPHHEQINQWLFPSDGKRGLKLTRVQQLLKGEGISVSYDALIRFARKHCDFGKAKVTVRMAETKPGEIAEVDFGRLGPVYDNPSGKNKMAHALLVTLPYSRHQYVHISFFQKLPDLIRALEDAWFFFGGTTLKLIIDNMKCAVTKADRYDPIFSRSFNEYADYRGITIDPAIVRHPTGKPHVERNVQYVRENFFADETG